jgi:hypothetical protein
MLLKISCQLSYYKRINVIKNAELWYRCALPVGGHSPPYDKTAPPEIGST